MKTLRACHVNNRPGSGGTGGDLVPMDGKGRRPEDVCVCARWTGIRARSMSLEPMRSGLTERAERWFIGGRIGENPLVAGAVEPETVLLRSIYGTERENDSEGRLSCGVGSGRLRFQ